MIKKSLGAAFSIAVLDFVVFSLLSDYPIVVAVLFFLIPFLIMRTYDVNVVISIPFSF